MSHLGPGSSDWESVRPLDMYWGGEAEDRIVESPSLSLGTTPFWEEALVKEYLLFEQSELLMRWIMSIREFSDFWDV